MGPLGRLRWQLTLAHLVSIACTLVAMVGAIVLITTFWFHGEDNADGAAAQDARTVASAISPMVGRGAPPEEVNLVLGALVRGDLQLYPGYGPPWASGGRRPDWLNTGLRDVAYIVVFDRDGHPLASSAPPGGAFAPPERSTWEPLVSAALANRRELPPPAAA